MGYVPCSVEHGQGEGNALVWVCPLQQLDYDHYLPVFLEGIRSGSFFEPLKRRNSSTTDRASVRHVSAATGVKQTPASSWRGRAF